MLKGQIVSLSSTPVDLTYSGVIDPCIAISIQNIMNSGYAYLGGPNVSSTNYGHKLFPRQSFTIELAPNDKLYAVGDSGVSVAVLSLDIG
jgi:hypothetical protein